MADKFDPYREGLVMEQTTQWPQEYADMPLVQRREVEQALHAHPESCSELEYIRTHTGFCRKITVTEDDLQRVA